MSVKRIGILTGGGDVPGLNSVIKSVVYRGAEIGCEVLGIRNYSLVILSEGAEWEGYTVKEYGPADAFGQAITAAAIRNVTIFGMDYVSLRRVHNTTPATKILVNTELAHTLIINSGRSA
jgi:hypothetical protein